MSAELAEADWTKISQLDVEDMWQETKNIIKKMQENHMPKITTKSQSKWLIKWFHSTR